MAIFKADERSMKCAKVGLPSERRFANRKSHSCSTESKYKKKFGEIKGQIR